MGQAKSLTGASLILYINNKPIGIVDSVQWTINTTKRAIFGLDQVTPYEIAPGAVSITGKIDCTRIRLDGGLEGRGIVANTDDLLLEKYINIVLVERLTDTTVFRVDQASVSSQTWTVTARGLMKGSFNFEGLDYRNESKV